MGEMKPALDVLFHSYDYEKEQLQIMDTMSSDEYKNLVTAYKTNRTMALRLKSDLLCCKCKNSLVQSMDNGSKEEVVLFGCGHAIHRSCLVLCDVLLKDVGMGSIRQNHPQVVVIRQVFLSLWYVSLDDSYT